MHCEKLSRLYQKVPNLFQIVDRLFHSEPFIEKLSSFEAKALLASHSISAGVFFNKQVKTNVKIFMWFYHIGCTLVISASCTFYLWSLKSYNLGAVTVGLAPILLSNTKLIYLVIVTRLHNSIDQLMEFFIYDDIQSTQPSNLRSASGATKVKKWVIIASLALFCFLIANEFIFDPQSQIKRNGFTSRSFLTKYFPVWCPFESFWTFAVVSIFQDAVVIPGTCIFISGSFAIFLGIVLVNEKFNVLNAKLRLLSDCAFERIDKFEKELKEVMEMPNNRNWLSDIKILDEKRIYTMTKFYEDFLPYIGRYQQLKRIQLLAIKFLGYYCSVTYCIILSTMIGFGFVGAEAFSGQNLDINLIIRMLIKFFVCGILWFINCLVGDIFSEQNDSFVGEVYSMPWYYFSPKQRKTVLTLLSVVQKPMYLRALKLIRVKKDTFPDFSNSVYSYIQIMRTFQMVKNRKG